MAARYLAELQAALRFGAGVVDLLNKVRLAFARLIQDALLHEVLLHLSRLTDPASSGKNKDGTDRGEFVVRPIKTCCRGQF